MARKILAAAVLAGATLMMTVPADAEIGIGADVVSRYVWRGQDLGSSVSVQPSISCAKNNLEIGAWSSWAISDGGADENDLYVTYSMESVAVTLTDYYNPPGEFLDYDKDTGAHTIEIMGEVDLGIVSVMGAFNVHGDKDDSFYAQVDYPCPKTSTENVDVTFSAALGNGGYSADDDDPKLVVLSITADTGDHSASWILNPDSEIAYLVFGTSF